MPEIGISSLLDWIQFPTLADFSSFISRQLDARIGFFISSFNETIALTIPILTNLLQLKKETPFSTHPRTMRVAVSTTIVFYVAYTALLRFPLRRRLAIIADHCLFSIGNASVASLSSVLLPDSYAPYVFAVFGLLSVAELLYWLYNEFLTGNNDDDEFVVRRMRISELFNNVRIAFTNLTGPILPV